MLASRRYVYHPPLFLIFFLCNIRCYGDRRIYLPINCRYYTSILSALISVDVFLGSFVIFGMVLASSVVGPQFLQPAAHTPCNQVALVAPNIPCPATQLNLFKIAQVLGACSVICLFLGCISDISPCSGFSLIL